MEVIRHMYTFVFMYICICICMCIYTYIEVSGRLKWLSFDCSHITEMVPGGRDGSDTSAKKGLHPDLLNIAHCFNCICICTFKKGLHPDLLNIAHSFNCICICIFKKGVYLDLQDRVN